MENKLIKYLKYVLVILSLLTSVTYLNSTVLRDGFKLCFLASFLLVAYTFYKNKNRWNQFEYKILLLFCISYAFTIIFNVRNHFINEVLILGYLFMSFFLMTYLPDSKSQERILNEIFSYCWIIIGVTFVFSSINVILFYLEELDIISLENVKYLYSFEKSYQLGGLFNPNVAGMLSMISLLLSALFLYLNKHFKFFNMLNVIIQGICFSLIQSRGSWVCLLAFLFFFIMFVLHFNKTKFTGFKKYVYKFLIACGASLLLMGTSFISRQLVSFSINVIQLNDKTIDREKKEDDSLNSITTGRSGLWKVGFEAYKEEPILGIGYRSIDDALKKHLTKYDYKNSAQGGLHNVYITTFVSSGAVGFFIFSLFLLYLIFTVFKIVFHYRFSIVEKFFVSLVPVLLVGELVESRIVFGMNFITVLFWILTGYVFYLKKRMNRHD